MLAIRTLKKSERTSTTPNYSSSVKENDSHYLRVPRAKLLKRRDQSFDSKMDSKRLNSIFDESQDIHSQSFLEPSLHNESSMMDHYHPKLHASETTGKRTPYGRSPSPFSESGNKSNVLSGEKRHKLLHKKAHMIHNQLYFIEIVRADG